jgi:uncharacterized protein YxeA
MKNVLVTITYVILSIVSVKAQSMTVYCDTLQKFNFIGTEDPILKIERMEVNLPSYVIDEKEFIFDFTNMTLTKNGKVVTLITEVIDNSENIFFSYVSHNEGYVGHILITDAVHENIDRKLILVWETNGIRTLGSFGYLD